MTTHLVDAYWSVNCRASIDPRDQHWMCRGLWEWPEDNGEPSGQHTRCVCPCHDGFDPETGER